MKIVKRPISNRALRNAIYAGKVLRIPATPASKLLVHAVELEITAEFGSANDLRRLQFHLSGEELYRRIGKVRQLLLSEQYRELLFSLLAEQGFGAQENAVDPVRLRAVAHLGHENPLAAPAYTAHRDTWYANPQAQVNWWIPLHDVKIGETFAFYPECFRTAVSNNSGDFDYDEWVKTVGWQSTAGKKAVYPSVSEPIASQAVPFSCNAADIILFSAAQLHQTTENCSGQTRFSVDFRTVNLADHRQGKAAPNVDNSSRGNALRDYLGGET